MHSLLNPIQEHRIEDVKFVLSRCGTYFVIGYFDVPTLSGSPIPKAILYSMVKSNQTECYTERGLLGRTYVFPVDGAGHEPYLRTVANDTETDNLLSLPGALELMSQGFKVRLCEVSSPSTGLLSGIISRANREEN